MLCEVKVLQQNAEREKVQANADATQTTPDFEDVLRGDDPWWHDHPSFRAMER